MSESTDLARKLEDEGEKIASFFAALTPEEWSREIYTEGSSWTVRSILAHLMTTERAFLKLFPRIQQGGEGVSEDFVVDRYNARQQEKTRDATAAELLGQFREARAEMAAWVAGLTETDLDSRGRHPFLGITTLREMLKLLYIHGQTHSRDVRRALRAASPQGE